MVILLTIIALLILQISCLIYAICKQEDPIDILYGFALWGVVPIAFLNLFIVG